MSNSNNEDMLRLPFALKGAMYPYTKRRLVSVRQNAAIRVHVHISFYGIRTPLTERVIQRMSLFQGYEISTVQVAMEFTVNNVGFIFSSVVKGIVLYNIRRLCQII